MCIYKTTDCVGGWEGTRGETVELNGGHCGGEGKRSVHTVQVKGKLLYGENFLKQNTRDFNNNLL